MSPRTSSRTCTARRRRQPSHFASTIAIALRWLALCASIALILTSLLGSVALAAPHGGGPAAPLGRGVVEAPTAVASAKSANREAAPDRVLVRFKRGASATRKAAALAQAGVRARKNFRFSGVSSLAVTDKGTSVADVVRRLEESGAVEYAVPDYRVHTQAAFPNDPDFSSLWGLHNTGQTGGTPDADIGAPEAWDVTTGDPSVVVAVIDTGIDYTHPDLAANVWRNPGEVPNGLDDDGNGYVDDLYGMNAVYDNGDPFDDHSHGTHVAGTIGASGDDGVGVVGVNWDVQIMALKFLDSSGGGWTSDAIECLEYAILMKTTYGVNLKLTSNSWGGGGFDPALYDAIEASGAAGMLFVAAAGNTWGRNDNDTNPAYPASYDLSNIVAVAATDHTDSLAEFSHFGHHGVDLGAPGVGILSTVPGNAYAWYDGTSMATPHVSGAAALVWALLPDADPLGVKDLLMASGDPIPALAERTVSGNRLNVANALHFCELGEPVLATSPGDGFRAPLAEPLVVGVVLRDCTEPILGATVRVETPEGETIAVRDDGVGPDLAADDGRYTALWTPRFEGPVTLSFAATFAGDLLHASAAGTVYEVPVYTELPIPFSWVDATVGTDTGLYVDDGSVEIPIGFEFPFYGELHDMVKISSNGFVTFGADGWSYWNQPIPSASEPNTLVAPYWDDLLPAVGGGVYYLLEGEAPNRSLTVEWHGVPYFSETSASASFEVTLFESGMMRFQYLDVGSGYSANGASATIGIEDASGTAGFQHSFDRASVLNGTALVILPAAECNDGRDNDGDGLVDHPADEGCRWEWDSSETPGRCGLLGIEVLLALPLVLRRRNRSGAQRRT